ncbi:MAG: hypothetical protein CMP47_15265 [Rickettsiales bacterium]|nr:hypothetical protein [Rickettsiales bacterium]
MIQSQYHLDRSYLTLPPSSLNMSLGSKGPSDNPLGSKWPSTQIAYKKLFSALGESRLHSIAPRNPHPQSNNMSDQPRLRAEWDRNADHWKNAGLFAPKDFEPGDLIFSEYATIVCDSDELGRRPWKDRYQMSRERWDEYLTTIAAIAASAMPSIRGFLKKGTIAGLEYPADADCALEREAYPNHMTRWDFFEWCGMSFGESTWRDETVWRGLARILEDALRLQDDRGKWVYVFGLLVGLMNHACHPNAIYRWDAKQPAGVVVPAVTLQVYAVKPIKKGEEITRSYRPLDGTVDEYIGSLRYMFGFCCRCDTCVTSEQDRNFRILRKDVYNLRVEWSTLGKDVQRLSKMYRMAALLLDGYFLLDLNHEPVGELYFLLINMAFSVSDAIRAYYFAICMKFWFAERNGRPEAEQATNMIRGIQNNKEAIGESTEGHSIFEDYNLIQEGLPQLMFMLNHSPDDDVYRCLEVVDGLVEEVPLAEVAETTKEREESLPQLDEAISTPVREEKPVAREVRGQVDTKVFPKHEAMEILSQAASMADKVFDGGYETGAADGSVNESPLAVQQDSDHLDKPEAGHLNVPSVNGHDSPTSRSVEDLPPSQLDAVNFLSQFADMGSTSNDGPGAIVTPNESEDEQNTNDSSAVPSHFSPRGSKSPPTIPQPLVAPSPVRSPSASLGGDFTTPRPQKEPFKRANPLYNQPERTTRRSEADEASWKIAMPRRRRNQAGDRASTPARHEVQKNQQVKKGRNAPATKTFRDCATQTEQVCISTPGDRQVNIDLEKRVAELESRNQFLEAVAGLVAEKDALATVPFVCPFGAEDGTSKSAWLACAASREALCHNPRDVGHLLAAKDGVGARLEGFVLRARRDSVCGRMEGEKEVFVAGGRLRAHSFGNDASKRDFLKQAEVRESKEY